MTQIMMEFPPRLSDGTTVSPPGTDRPDPSNKNYRKYLTWRWTLTGLDDFLEIERRALLEYQQGAKRIEINKIVAELRAENRRTINNTYRSWISRELRESHPELRPLIHIRRQRRAA